MQYIYKVNLKIYISLQFFFEKYQNKMVIDITMLIQKEMILIPYNSASKIVYNINAKTDYEETPLHITAIVNNIDTLTFLAENGADVNL